MSDYPTVAEVYRMQYLLIERFGGKHGVRDKNAVEAAVFRPQTGYYNSLEEEAAALMESLGNNHGFLDGNKRIAFNRCRRLLEQKWISSRCRGGRWARIYQRINEAGRVPFRPNPCLDSPAHETAKLVALMAGMPTRHHSRTGNQ